MGFIGGLCLVLSWALREDSDIMEARKIMPVLQLANTLPSCQKGRFQRVKGWELKQEKRIHFILSSRLPVGFENSSTTGLSVEPQFPADGGILIAFEKCLKHYICIILSMLELKSLLESNQDWEVCSGEAC